CLQYNNAPFTF
nr:immunoglobulin light chain junction region [Macaca mulatta]MOW10574.1 immunoglobulin light chain junction region [Macaca mulatta]MOW11550.1 immunoglobulin light chain junction region [Macaca mulatta]MOW11589.1 immunoglobulin light chain junction region [Macaca mulatta]MOW12081.1 immunoglobulin light chain junction region [Macaca mulatta]